MSASEKRGPGGEPGSAPHSSPSPSHEDTNRDAASRAEAGAANIPGGTPMPGETPRSLAGLANVPAQLQGLPRWVGWRYVTKPGDSKPDKVPHSTGTKPKPKNATKTSNGILFKHALEALADKRKKLDGIGFILGDGLAGVDVDDCIDEHGNLNDHGRRISERFRDTYAEISPSGRGFKVFIDIGDDAQLAAVNKNAGTLEVYGSARYFTVTGQRLAGHPATVAHMPDAFRQTAEEAEALKPAPKPGDGDDAGRDGSGRWAHHTGHTLKDVYAALLTISANCDNGTWFNYAQAMELQFGEDGWPLFLSWSESATEPGKYLGEEHCRKLWDRCRRNNDALGVHDKPVTVATIIRDAAKPTASDAGVNSDDEYILVNGDDYMKNGDGAEFSSALGVLFPVGVVALAGPGGHGKSTLAATGAAAVTSGKPCPPWESKNATRAPAHVLWLTTEEDRKRIILPRHKALGGDLRLIHVPVINTKLDEDGHPVAVGFSIVKHLPSLLRQARDDGHPIKLVVADALPALGDWDGRGTSGDTDVKKFIMDLSAIVMEHDACLFGIMHFNKKFDVDDAYRTSGSQAWRDSPRLSFICKEGHVYVNKTNDIPEFGCEFHQEVVETLHEYEVETRDGKPMPVTARRAAFGPYLLPKAEVLEMLEIAKAEAKATDREHKPARVDAMAKIVRELFDVLGDGVPASTMWREVLHGYGSAPNSEEKKQIAERLGIESKRTGMATTYYKLPRAMPT